jgi:hypothetical protein
VGQPSAGPHRAMPPDRSAVSAPSVTLRLFGCAQVGLAPRTVLGHRVVGKMRIVDGRSAGGALAVGSVVQAGKSQLYLVENLVYLVDRLLRRKWRRAGRWLGSRQNGTVGSARIAALGTVAPLAMVGSHFGHLGHLDLHGGDRTRRTDDNP